jgi:hypothetical protein
MSVEANIIRLEVDAGDPYRNPVNKQTGGPIQIARGKDHQFEIGIYSRGIWQDTVTNFSAVIVEVWDASTHITTRSLNVQGNSFVNCPQGSWDDNTSQHVAIVATAADTAAFTAAATGTSYWLVVSGLTSAGKKITLAAGTCTVVEDGGQYIAAAVSPGNPSYMTRDEVIGLFNALQRNLVLVSPDGTYQRKLGITDEGVPIDLLL